MVPPLKTKIYAENGLFGRCHFPFEMAPFQGTFVDFPRVLSTLGCCQKPGSQWVNNLYIHLYIMMAALLTCTVHCYSQHQIGAR